MMKSPLYYTERKIKLKQYFNNSAPDPLTFVKINGELVSSENIDEKYLDYYVYKRELINVNGKIGGVIYLLDKETQKELN